MSFRPYFPIRGIIGGLLMGLSAVVLLQQFAIVYPTAAVTVIAIVVAIIVVLLLANLRRASAIRRATPVAVAAAPAAAPASMGFHATHRAPAGGADAFEAPGAAAPVAHLDPGLDVALLEQRGDWAHVRCSNGWETWVDARVLTAI